MKDFVVPQGPVPTTLCPRTVQYQVLVARETAGVTLQVPAAGLEAIAGLPGLGRRILVYLGRDRLTKSGSIEILPFPQFVRLLEKREV